MKKVYSYFVDSPVAGKKTVLALASSKREAAEKVYDAVNGAPHVGIPIGKPLPLDDYLRQLLPKVTKLDNPMTAIASLEYVALEYGEAIGKEGVEAIRRIKSAIYEDFSE